MILHSNFWKLYNKRKIELDDNNYVKDKEDLEYIYNFDAYNKINKLNIGSTVTHEDNINNILNNKYNNSIKPFENIIIQQYLVYLDLFIYMIENIEI